MTAFGRYRLVEPIATGGMAEVWRAEVPGPEGFVKEVALKLVRGDLGAKDAFARMLVQEARLASRLNHANIVQVFDFDQVGGRYYIAMELVRGHNLREVLDRCRTQGVRLGLARSLQVACEVARALAYAHRLEEGGRPAGLVHRDVSPHNVLVSFEGEVKLTDFGIARALGVAEQTAPGTLKGKLAYMAPEQARGEAVDARADVFALGAVLWELCTGRRLFARDSDAGTLAALLSSEPVSRPSEWNEAVPPDLDAVVLEALERDPARRTPSAEALAEKLAILRLRLARAPEDLDLRSLMRRLWPEGASRPRPQPERTAVMPSPRSADATTRTAPGARRRSRGWMAAALGALALAGGAALWRSGARPGREAAHEATGDGGVAGSTPEAGAPPAAPAGTAGAEAPEASSAAPERPRPEAAGPGTGPQEATPVPSGAVSPPMAAGRPRRAPAGEGSLRVNALPWASVWIDDRPVGDTPLDARVPAGRHRLRAEHPTLGSDETVVNVTPGGRVTWLPKLKR